MNISQNEFTTKYNEYLLRVQLRKRRELLMYNNFEYLYEINSPKMLKTFTYNISDSEFYLKNQLPMSHYIRYFHGNFSNRNDRHSRVKRDIDSTSSSMHSTLATSISDNHNDIVFMRFDINNDNQPTPPSEIVTEIEEAHLRLFLKMFRRINKQNPEQYSRHHQIHRNHHRNNRNHSRRNMRCTKTLINLKIYQLIKPHGKIWLDNREIEINNYYDDCINQNFDTNVDILKPKFEHFNSQWLNFDVTKAVESWLNDPSTNLGLEINCENCKINGVKISHANDNTVILNNGNEMKNDSVEDVNNYDISLIINNSAISPVINVIGHFGSLDRSNNQNGNNMNNDNTGSNNYDVDELSRRDKRSRHNKHNQHHQLHSQHNQHHHFLQNVRRKPRKTDCYADNKKCCRHSMEVIFKEIKGFEFIIQPKAFDAGYCRGKCPPRYNPAHHHALLQSLIWKQDRKRAPRPCCAPSKLVELEVLHVDEKDPKKLKVSTWTDMRALECACS